LPLVRARPSESLADAWGINTHFGFQITRYGDEQRVINALLDLGVRHIRDRYKPGVDAVYNGFSGLAAHGVQVTATCGVFNDPSQLSMAELMAAVVHEYGSAARSVFHAFAGINEPNNDGLPWVAQTRRMQQALWRAAKSHTETSGIAVLGPPLARRIDGADYGMANDERTARDFARLGDLTEYCDIGNIHVYPGDGPPSNDIADFMSWSAAAFGALETYCTEGGYWWAENYAGGSEPVPEDVAGVYAPILLLEHYIRGNKFFSYQLIEDPDPTQSLREDSFGFLRADWSPKPQYLAMQRLLRLIGDPGPPFRQSGLRMSLTGGDADVRSVLLQKRNGTFYLCLWRTDTPLYDWDTKTHSGRYLRVNPTTVRVTLGAPAEASLYWPATQTAPARTWTSTTSLSVPLRGELAVVEIS
jgi:hypothetical protein